ncbi:DUF3800 domain-containing protein [Chlorogloeopsis fritschii PCC 9212]|uniref:DUF3800 domain-containing protein n=1 Tax=Chlorogloeopsis fritschii PCC 6912 TaxID=211165 RepID=A0A3S0Y490_CHLFR|nr:DUF3800 domain-containing protein [Chlorogloeopsis fritschii]RUR84953.1 hypothetical protein PCC6912_10690 [Chlorogloeopsis fritschii PCC 6912]
MNEEDEQEFALYLDDSGSAKPDPNDQYPFFAMGGVLIKRGDENLIKTLLTDLKNRWNIPQEIPLHGNEIRSRKKRFAWIGKLPQEEQNRFMEDLTITIISCPIIVHACVVSRHGYLKRYLELYGENTWEMMKSAFTILVERAAKYAALKNGTLMVYFESAGKTEDKLIKQYFYDLRSVGHPFDANRADKYFPLSAADLSGLLRGIDSKTKNNPVMQIADLCLYPVVRSKDSTNNQAFLSLRKANLLVDCCLACNQISTIGIKYYCFDD